MKLSIVIPAFNEARYITATLTAARQALDGNAHRLSGSEIIVCDNNSTDGTGDLARAGGARVVFEPHNQISRARNAGAAAASGDWLLFLDADTLLSQESVADMLDQIATARFVAGGGDIRFDGGGWIPHMVARSVVWLFRMLKLAGGAFLFCRADAFRAVGGFSEALYAAEEVALCRALKAWGRPQGLRFAFLTRHPVITSSRKLRSHGLSEFFRIALRGAFRPMSTLGSREHLAFFYDGKRG
jgi:glycosyltransferase involved in cell wall biosynthesis